MIKLNTIVILLLSLVLILASLIAGSSIPTTPHVGAVVLTDNDFDHTKIEDDLADMDLTEYPKDPNGTPVVIGVIEYCYTENMFKQGNYGIYFYVYNPAQTAYSTDEGANVVNMATEYGADGEPTNYENMPLTYLSKSTGDYAELFYKFKVTDASRLLAQATAYSKVHGGRRYDIAGLQLRYTTGAVKDCKVAYTYRYKGYAKGYNDESKDTSTLTCERNELETVDLDLFSTFYRPEGHNGDGVYTQDQLSSVYFAVPNSIKNRYERLYSVSAEWYRAVTDKIFVTDHSAMYDAIYPYLGRTDSANAGYGFGAQMGDPRYDVYYNDFRAEVSDPFNGKISALDYIFKVKAGTTATDYTVSAEDLKEFILKRSSSASGLFLGKYDLSMFAEYDTVKTAVEIKADDRYSLTGKVIAPDWWGNLFCQYDTDTYNGIEGIKEVKDKDFVKTPDSTINVKATCDNLYIDFNDYADFEDFYKQSVAADKTVYLLRYDVTQYTSVPVKLWYRATDLFGNTYNGTTQGNGYVAQVPAYLDFDVISLTYEKSGKYTVIPVVADPIDVFGDVTAPPNYDPILPNKGCNGLSWFYIVLIIIGGLIAFIIVYKLVRWFLYKLF